MSRFSASNKAARQYVNIVFACNCRRERDGHLDHGGAGVLLGGLNGAAQGAKVGVAVLDVLHVPAERLKALAHILCEGDLCVPVDGDPAAGSRSGCFQVKLISSYKAVAQLSGPIFLNCPDKPLRNVDGTPAV